MGIWISSSVVRSLSTGSEVDISSSFGDDGNSGISFGDCISSFDEGVIGWLLNGWTNGGLLCGGV